MSRENIIKKRGSHDRRRVFPKVRGEAPHNKAHKRTEATERTAAWRALNAEQQLSELDRRLGKNKGACAQRARIEARIAVERAAATKAIDTSTKRPKR